MKVAREIISWILIFFLITSSGASWGFAAIIHRFPKQNPASSKASSSNSSSTEAPQIADATTMGEGFDSLGEPIVQALPSTAELSEAEEKDSNGDETNREHWEFFESLELVEGKYVGVVVEIKDDVEEDHGLIEDIKDLLSNASAALESATESPDEGWPGLQFGEVTIVIPHHWGYTAPVHQEGGPAPAVVVSGPGPHWGHVPHTLQPGGCGEEGLHIYLTPDYIRHRHHPNTHRMLGPPGRVFLHEWAHYRWGVFDEYVDTAHNAPPLHGERPFYLDDDLQLRASVCPATSRGWIVREVKAPNNPEANRTPGYKNEDHVKDPLPASSELDMEICYARKNDSFPPDDCFFYLSSQDATQVSSLMGSVAEGRNAKYFCGGGAVAHNSDAPTPHNVMCGGRSVWEVMLQHRDFAHRCEKKPTFLRPSSSKSFVPKFHIRKRKHFSSLVVLLQCSPRWTRKLNAVRTELLLLNGTLGPSNSDVKILLVSSSPINGIKPMIFNDNFNTRSDKTQSSSSFLDSERSRVKMSEIDAANMALNSSSLDVGQRIHCGARHPSLENTLKVEAAKSEVAVIVFKDNIVNIKGEKDASHLGNIFSLSLAEDCSVNDNECSNAATENLIDSFWSLLKTLPIALKQRPFEQQNRSVISALKGRLNALQMHSRYRTHNGDLTAEDMDIRVHMIDNARKLSRNPNEGELLHKRHETAVSGLKKLVYSKKLRLNPTQNGHRASAVGSVSLGHCQGHTVVVLRSGWLVARLGLSLSKAGVELQPTAEGLKTLDKMKIFHLPCLESYGELKFKIFLDYNNELPQNLTIYSLGEIQISFYQTVDERLSIRLSTHVFVKREPEPPCPAADAAALTTPASESAASLPPPPASLPPLSAFYPSSPPSLPSLPHPVSYPSSPPAHPASSPPPFVSPLPSSVSPPPSPALPSAATPPATSPPASSPPLPSSPLSLPVSPPSVLSSLPTPQASLPPPASAPLPPSPTPHPTSTLSSSLPPASPLPHHTSTPSSSLPPASPSSTSSPPSPPSTSSPPASPLPISSPPASPLPTSSPPSSPPSTSSSPASLLPAFSPPAPPPSTPSPPASPLPTFSPPVSPPSSPPAHALLPVFSTSPPPPASTLPHPSSTPSTSPPSAPNPPLLTSPRTLPTSPTPTSTRLQYIGTKIPIVDSTTQVSFVIPAPSVLEFSRPGTVTDGHSSTQNEIPPLRWKRSSQSQSGPVPRRIRHGSQVRLVSLLTTGAGEPVLGAQVEAYVKGPHNFSAVIPLLDGGVGADTIAGDGAYSGFLTVVHSNGKHSITVRAKGGPSTSRLLSSTSDFNQFWDTHSSQEILVFDREEHQLFDLNVECSKRAMQHKQSLPVRFLSDAGQVLPLADLNGDTETSTETVFFSGQARIPGPGTIVVPENCFLVPPMKKRSFRFSSSKYGSAIQLLPRIRNPERHFGVRPSATFPPSASPGEPLSKDEGDSSGRGVEDFKVVAATGSFKVAELVEVEVEKYSPMDLSPPGRVTDLRVIRVHYNRPAVELQWTSPGDDLFTGTATSMELRYHTKQSVLRLEFGRATLVEEDVQVAIGSLAPVRAMELQNVTVFLRDVTLADLTHDQVFHFAVVLRDEAGNRGAMSNLAEAHFTLQGRNLVLQAAKSSNTRNIAIVSVIASIFVLVLSLVLFVKIKQCSRARKLRKTNEVSLDLNSDYYLKYCSYQRAHHTPGNHGTYPRNPPKHGQRFGSARRLEQRMSDVERMRCDHRMV